MEQDGSIKYDRYAFSREGWELTQTKTGEEINVLRYNGYNDYNEYEEYVFTESMPSIELNSIKKYGGFYIGRYEIGVEDGTQDLSGYDQESFVTPSEEWTGWKNGKAVVQTNKQVWNYITRDMAKKVAEGMYNNDVVISRLCSSYAWDTTLKFIELNNPEYGTNSEGDNYSGTVEHTGVGSAPRNNIYDMGGNVGEWTTEVFSRQDAPCTIRGGFCSVTASDTPAGHRYIGMTTQAHYLFGFRSTLFVGL